MDEKEIEQFYRFESNFQRLKKLITEPDKWPFINHLNANQKFLN